MSRTARRPGWHRLSMRNIVAATIYRVRFRQGLRAQPSHLPRGHANRYVGLTEQAAEQRARAAGFKARVYWRDGRHVGGLDNRQRGRVNFFVARRRVIDAQLF